MEGFDAGEQTLPERAHVDDETRGRLIRVLMAIAAGDTPEEIAGYLNDGFPGHLDWMLGRPLELAEFGAYVDLVLSAS